VSDLNKILIAAQEDLPITMRHDKWLANNPNISYPDLVVQVGMKELLSKQRDRRKHFSASSAGDCQRKQIFTYIGLPRKKIESSLVNIFHTGNFIHLKWQLAGLTEGWLTDIEIPLISAEFPVRGTMDGIVWDGSGFEFKSINDNGYKSVMQFGPKKAHINQVHAYMFLGGYKSFSVVYENKNNGEWREFRVHRDEKIIDALKTEWSQLENSVVTETLPQPLNECKQKEGMYRMCPFKDTCLKIRGMSDARNKISSS